jgi:hypothetical protein
VLFVQDVGCGFWLILGSNDGLDSMINKTFILGNPLLNKLNNLDWKLVLGAVVHLQALQGVIHSPCMHLVHLLNHFVAALAQDL